MLSVGELVAVAKDFGLGYVTLDTDEVAAVLRRLKNAEDELRALKQTRSCARSFAHPAHKWMLAHRVVRCPGVQEDGDG